MADWFRHRIVCALLPDEIQRRQYIASVAILKILRDDQPKDSLWIPREIKAGYARCVDLGRDAVALYPPNASTLGHHVVFRNLNHA